MGDRPGVIHGRLLSLSIAPYNHVCFCTAIRLLAHMHESQLHASHCTPNSAARIGIGTFSQLAFCPRQGLLRNKKPSPLKVLPTQFRTSGTPCFVRGPHNYTPAPHYRATSNALLLLRHPLSLLLPQPNVAYYYSPPASSPTPHSLHRHHPYYPTPRRCHSTPLPHAESLTHQNTAPPACLGWCLHPPTPRPLA